MSHYVAITHAHHESGDFVCTCSMFVLKQRCIHTIRAVVSDTVGGGDCMLGTRMMGTVRVVRLICYLMLTIVRRRDQLTDTTMRCQNRNIRLLLTVHFEC